MEQNIGSEKPFLLTRQEFDAAFNKPDWALNCCSALFSAIQTIEDHGVAQVLSIIGEEIVDKHLDAMSLAQCEILKRHMSPET